MVDATPRPQRQDAGSRRVDDYLTNLLATTPPLSPAEAEALAGWWQAEAPPGEGLAAFLVRQGIFTAAAAKTVAMMEKGYVTFPDARHLFGPRGMERARARFECVALTPAPAAPYPTVRVPPVAATAPAAPPAPRSRPAPAPGQVLGKCLLTEVLGQGGGGLVFRALHQGLNIPVAVKVLHRAALEGHPGAYERFKAEARLLAQLNHPQVVRVLDFEDDAAFPFLVMEYVEGWSLEELLNQAGALRLARAVRVISQVAEGLAAAWRAGIVHRDVKPANILLTKEGQAKVADLGLALAVRGPVTAAAPTAPPAPGEIAGTVGYMAPEQCTGGPAVDHRTDVYSLGATFYHALTGRPPFRGATPLEVMLKHVREPVPPPHDVAPEVPAAASAVVQRMLAKAPADRHQTYEELAADLADLARLEAAAPTAAAATPRPESIHQRTTRTSFWKGLLSLTRGGANP